MKAGVLATSYSKIGGARHIFSNDTSLHVLLVGCNVSVERMPTVGNKLPAGTMIKCDSSKQNGGDIHYSFRMYEKSDSGATVKHLLLPQVLQLVIPLTLLIRLMTNMTSLHCLGMQVNWN